MTRTPKNNSLVKILSGTLYYYKKPKYNRTNIRIFSSIIEKDKLGILISNYGDNSSVFIDKEIIYLNIGKIYPHYFSSPQSGDFISFKRDLSFGFYNSKEMKRCNVKITRKDEVMFRMLMAGAVFFTYDDKISGQTINSSTSINEIDYYKFNKDK